MEHNNKQKTENTESIKFREEKISQSSLEQKIDVKEVFKDIKRNGEEETQLLIKAFINATEDKLRYAQNFGYKGLVVYVALGSYRHMEDSQLILLSAHVPGNSGGGGWGLKGKRKLLLVRNISNNIMKLINNPLSCAYEDYDKRIHYHSKIDPSYCTLLKIEVERARAHGTSEE